MKSNKKNILVLLPSNYQLYSLIEKNLLEKGYDATVLTPDLSKFRYKNLYQKIINFYQKTFFNNKDYKKKLREEFATQLLIKAIDKHSSYDYVLVIRADFFSLEILNHVRSKTQNLVSYHFDGINRYPKIFERISIFERFYVFDREDIDQHRNIELLPCTNFYFDYPELPDLNIKFDFYFLVPITKVGMKYYWIFKSLVKNTKWWLKWKLFTIKKINPVLIFRLNLSVDPTISVLRSTF